MIYNDSTRLIDALIRDRDAVLKQESRLNPDKPTDKLLKLELEGWLLKYQILNALEENYPFLTADYVLEALTTLGYSPTLSFDDNANWAVTAEGYQPIVFGNQKIEGQMTAFYEKGMWKRTIRRAVYHFLMSIK